MRRVLACLLTLLLLVSAVACASGGDGGEEILVICTSFSQYDWAREILGETEGVTLRLLADGGKDMHSYSPSATDMMAILGCDLLIYGGGVSEAWIEELATEGKIRAPLSLMSVLGEDLQYMESHGHEVGHSHEECEVDEHIWLSLKNAVRFCEAIREAICAVDAANAAVYEANCASYIEKLTALDRDFEQLVSGAEQRSVVLADRYPYRYLFADYGITCYAAFEGCSAESDASVSTVISLAKTADELGVRGLLVTETSDGRLANTVREGMKAKNAEVFVLNALQSVPDAEATSYLAVMRQNLGVLQALLG